MAGWLRPPGCPPGHLPHHRVRDGTDLTTASPPSAGHVTDGGYGVRTCQRSPYALRYRRV